MPETPLPPTLTTAQRREHYDDFVAAVLDLCATNSIRSDLASGRGRPLEECGARMQQYLVARVSRYGARRAHYTVASLIAMQRHLVHEDGLYTPEFAVPAPDDSTTEAARLPAAESDSPLDEPAHTPVPGSSPAGGPVAGERTAVRHWRARPDLGSSLAIAVARHGFKQHRMDDQVKILTRLSSPLLHPLLWRLTSRLANRDAARLDFAVLLEDLARWDYDQLHIADRWRESYFQTLDRLVSQED
ncbi:CRISPR-associated protein Cse2 [Streptomyces sp. NBC_01451]|uniref:CRISPR-associated protein Cse2 n=1 Tax=Streptomyces sp. NBC_01451 TaxID=2903872 RepID=UPI002E307F17|nr:CRISPR-associated protein Cse2 [Streptomyces sp. NBC_01451]